MFVKLPISAPQNPAFIEEGAFYGMSTGSIQTDDGEV